MSIDDEAYRLAMAQKAWIDRILDRQTRDLVRAWARAWDETADELHRNAMRMAQDLADMDGHISYVIRDQKAKKALALISARLEALCKQAGVRISTDARHMIRQAQAQDRALITAQLPSTAVGITLVRADADQIAAIVQRTTETIVSRMRPLSAEADAQMRRQLVRGVALGTNPRETARRMVQQTKGVFDGGLIRALVISRTETLDAHRSAARASRMANADVLQAWQWCATLTGRTCPSCLSMHGSLHPIDEPGPMDHHQGRCVALPVVKPWRDLGIDLPEPEPDLKPGDGVRWLREQPEQTQRDVLGPKRYEAWQQGDFPPDQWSVRRQNAGWRDSYNVGSV